jgi:DNA-binding beta-propeller fold protein YncE
VISSARSLTLAVTAVGVVLMGASGALAATGPLEYEKSFVLPEGTPNGVAVDQKTHEVYVADGANKVYVFNANGVQTGQVDCGVCSEVRGVAVNDATGEVYLADSGLETVVPFNATGVQQKLWSRELGCDTHSVYAAVDNSTSPSDPAAGDVYVLAATGMSVLGLRGPNGERVKFQAKKPYIREQVGQCPNVTESTGEGSELTGTPEGTFTSSPGGIAVDSANGYVYVSEGPRGSTEAARVVVLAPTGEYLHELDVSLGAAAPPGIAVDAATGESYVTGGDGNALSVSNYGGGLRYSLTDTEVGKRFGSPSGVAVDETTGDVYMSDAGERAVDVFHPGPVLAPQPPEALGPTMLATTAATLAIAFTPEAGVTDQLEYGSTNTYGQTVPIKPGATGLGPETQAIQLTGLQPGQEYHYRLSAADAAGTMHGPDETFVTHPASTETPAPPPGFSLTSGEPMAPTATTYPNLAGVSPARLLPTPKPPTPKRGLTNNQRLAKLLKLCAKMPKNRQSGCVKRARMRYAHKEHTRKVG